MRVLFIHPMPHPSLLILQKLTYHYGIGILSAVLKQHGHATDLMTMYRVDQPKLRNKIRDFQPDLVGISVTSQQLELTRDIADFISDEFGLPVVLGGVHPTVRPEESIEIRGAFGICLGEGEFALLELVEAMEKNDGRRPDDLRIDNFWFKSDEGIIKNPIRPLCEDLDSLPFCDREILDFQKLLNYHGYLEIRSSRGCPFKCTFCVNSSYQDIYRHKGRYYRVRSHESILAEIDDLVTRYDNISSIVFDDELISVNKKWTTGFFEKYRARYDFPFNITVRADLVEKEFMQTLKDAGCNMVMMGVENGDEHLRNTILDKGISDRQIIDAARIIKDTGIKLWTFNMVGVPYETTETVEKTIQLNRDIKPDIVFISTFYPFPGTRLGELCEKEGWISDRKVDGFFSNVTVLDQPSITRQKVAYYSSIFPWAIMYPRLSFIIKLLCRIRVGRDKSLYDLFYPVVKTVYEVYHRFKVSLNLLPSFFSRKPKKSRP